MAGTMEKENNIRVCLACGAKADKAKLVRFVAAGGRLVPDWRGVLPGRAVYACPTPACIGRFYGLKRVPDRFFKGTPIFAVPRGEIMNWVRAQAGSSVAHFLGLARKSGAAAAGQNTLAEASGKGASAPAALLLATDLAERTARGAAGVVPEGVPVLRWGTKEALGAALGMRPVGVVALAPSPITERIVHYVSIVHLFSQES